MVSCSCVIMYFVCKYRLLQKFNLDSSRVLVNKYVRNQCIGKVTKIHPLVCKRHFSSTTDDTNNLKSKDSDSDIEVKYHIGLPQLIVPLPSRDEKCQFTLRPVTHSVGDFLKMLKTEDQGIDRALILNDDYVKLASSCSIESLLNDDFWLVINDKKYRVKPPPRNKITTEELSKIGDVQYIVAQLYEALNVNEHQAKKERELLEKLEELKESIAPLEEQKTKLDYKAKRRSNFLTWLGLGLMSVQFGILARLTWWEYSWDIMEPVTYFVTYGTGMGAFAYYCITKQDYALRDVENRNYLVSMHKKAKKTGFDLANYNIMRQNIAAIEYDLKRLHDPLYMKFAPSKVRPDKKIGVKKIDDDIKSDKIKVASKLSATQSLFTEPSKQITNLLKSKPVKGASSTFSKLWKRAFKKTKIDN